MASKTRMTSLVRALDVEGVRADLAEKPDLLPVCDERGRTWLHLTAMIEVGEDPTKAAASVALADLLIGLGLDMNDAAFTENDGAWRATPLWCAVSRGRNLVLARHLLERGCDPNHSIWAAVYNRDIPAIRLLRTHGATLATDGDEFLWAIGLSHFDEAEELLRQGADVNAVGKDGRTALHMMLKKGSDIAPMRMVAGFGARGDIPDREGQTAAAILGRKRDSAFRELALKLASA